MIETCNVKEKLKELGYRSVSHLFRKNENGLLLKKLTCKQN
jgi:hypothetical protein